MRSQGPNQDPGNEPKKSVFDRLGRQIDAGRSMSRRLSPGHYGEYVPPPMHEMDYARYGRDPMGRGEIDWRFHEDRRHKGMFPDDRHPGGPPPPPPPQLGPQGPSMYEIEMLGRQQPPYFAGPHMYGQPGLPPPPQPLGPGGMPMGIHQRRSSPKYDRHGNLIPGFKERGGSMMVEDHHGISPPRNFMLPGPMHGGPHEMLPMRPIGMYPLPRWHDNLEPDFHPFPSRIMQEHRFSPFEGGPHRYNPQPMMEGPPEMLPMENEPPRYTKWKERRDVITTLDKETAQSSYRTDYLRSSLQHPENKNAIKNKGGPVVTKTVVKKEQTNEQGHADAKLSATSGPKKEPRTTDPQDISDGEIIDDEDSSDESDLGGGVVGGEAGFTKDVSYQTKTLLASHNRPRDYYEPTKKRRMLERDDHGMDYETISDEDLDDFMEDKKISADDSKMSDPHGEDSGKSVSEIELLNALGLDWAHLVEMAKQTKSSNKDSSPGSALLRFSPANYIPTLGITPELAGPEIFDVIRTICKV